MAVDNWILYTLMKPTVSKVIFTCIVGIFIPFLFIHDPVQKSVHAFAAYSDRMRLQSGNRFIDGDFKEVLNPHDYKIIYNEPDKCKIPDGVFLLVLIHSNPTNEKLRIKQRESCLSLTEFMGRNIVTLFLLGKVKDRVKAERLGMESLKYGDIIMEDFVDSYYNLTLKLIMGMKWASLFCPNAKYILKADDDVFINLEHIVKMLISAPSSNYMAGYVYKYATPYRNPTSKWYVAEKQYPYKYYPPFCRGYAYLISGDLPVRLVNVSVHTPFFMIDDVFMGFLARRVNISPTSKVGFLGPGSDDVSFCTLNMSYAVHLGSNSKRIVEYWREQQENPLHYTCSKVAYYISSLF